VPGVEIRRLVAVRLARQFGDLHAENFGDLADHAHPVEGETAVLDLGQPRHRSADLLGQCRLIPTLAMTSPRDPLARGHVLGCHVSTLPLVVCFDDKRGEINHWQKNCQSMRTPKRRPLVTCGNSAM